ncbi:DUF4347 domain-containing protein [Aphanizomenon flos-aquae]|uniref:DUF4347 domain-containing protein n=1 Tax=Aphanizomenon flos-aquae TaxID=1176 RepID=UPI0004862A34|nr:DUF4347 domain-containing protein [Aphanizomenon flos-aquae]
MTNNQMHAPHLVVIDAAVDDRKFLIKGVLPDADVMVLDRHRDGIAQIDEVLRAGDFRALQIVTHGSEGELRLGNTSLKWWALPTLQTLWRDDLRYCCISNS